MKPAPKPTSMGGALSTFDFPVTPRTPHEIRELDRLAIEEYGIPDIDLMENAGHGAARVALDMVSTPPPNKKIMIFCGKGNNGGDGFVVARYLHDLGFKVECIEVGFQHTPEALEAPKNSAEINLKRCVSLGIPIFSIQYSTEVSGFFPSMKHDSILLIDALLGTGLQGDVRSPMAETIDAINRARSKGIPVLAIDSPSGLNGSTGAILGHCVHADKTVTFAAPKIGFYEREGPKCCGEITLIDISIPRVAYKEVN